jgi:hypothetical protein
MKAYQVLMMYLLSGIIALLISIGSLALTVYIVVKIVKAVW